MTDRKTDHCLGDEWLNLLCHHRHSLLGLEYPSFGCQSVGRNVFLKPSIVHTTSHCLVAIWQCQFCHHHHNRRQPGYHLLVIPELECWFFRIYSNVYTKCLCAKLRSLFFHHCHNRLMQERRCRDYQKIRNDPHN